MKTTTFKIVALIAAMLPAMTSLGDRSINIYEAKSEFMLCLGSNGRGDYEEAFNTWQSAWRSEGIYTKIIQRFRANYPNATETDRELWEMLRSSKLELVPRSRLVTIAVRSKVPELAAIFANAYAEEIDSFTDMENRVLCDKAVAQVHDQVLKQKRQDDELARKLLEFRTQNSLDSLEAERTILNQRFQATMADVLEYERRVAAAKLWVDWLEAAKKHPENYGELPTDVPRSADIATVYAKLQSVKTELAKLGGYTKKHPEVQKREKELDALTIEFNASVNRAYATAVADLVANTNRLDSFRRNSEELKKKIDVLGLQIVKADAGLKQLEQEKKVSSEIYQDLLQKENELRIATEQNNLIIRVVRPAQIPR